ncbi:uncharacterized protein METZ01_LOCUS267925 [marine metagenome]|uniref:Uncharacterized protein n=1 Tax=marine metagenome TaxID=408172 RepID=A0A382JWZ0_9ZZZZ
MGFVYKLPAMECEAKMVGRLENISDRGICLLLHQQVSFILVGRRFFDGGATWWLYAAPYGGYTPPH